MGHIHKSVVIGSYTIIEDGVEIGEGTEIGNFVVIKSGTRIGKNNKIFSGVQLGTDPQDYHFKGEYSECIIGDSNIIREYATISRATGKKNQTIIGNNNFIMTYVHIAHNVRIGNNTVIASGSQLGGYVEVDDFATIGGLAGVHQFCRIGKYAMLGAKSYLNKDLPPYFLASGNRARVYGVNNKGLAKYNFAQEELEQIKQLFKLIYKSKLNLQQALTLMEKESNNQYAEVIIRFIRNSKRGILLR